MGVKHDYVCTKQEEIANIATSGFGVFMSALCIRELWIKSNSSDKQLSTLLYSSSLILLFGSSAIFHWYNYKLKCQKYPLTKKNIKLQRIFQLIDKTAIYFVITSSYAPWYTLVQFPENSWISSMKQIYSMAAFGTLFELTLAQKYPIVGVSLYILVGALTPLLIFAQTSAPGFMKVILSSSIYLSGVAFFLSDGYIPYAHAIWHVFTLVGTITHFNNVYLCFYL